MAASLDTIAREDFAVLEGQTLVLETAGGATAPAKLLSVTSLGYNRPAVDGGRESFRFVLAVDPTLRLGQGCYTLVHPTAGRLEIFLVPIARDASGLKLEAIFNFA